MNKQHYKLVFSRHLGMLVPVSEVVRGNAGKNHGGRLRAAHIVWYLLTVMAAIEAGHAFADQPAGLVKHATKAWSGADIDAARTGTQQMTIKQTQPKAVLNWQKLNLGKGENLNFDQGGNRSWAALNRIYDANPSVISGNVKADGHIYLVNQNGIVFGNGAQINVGSLTATTLDDIANDDIITRFNNGIVGESLVQAFIGSGGLVKVEAGAAITTATNGRVMLLAQDVENSGVINTPEGQTILAAGKTVYLARSDDPAGLLVEVSAGGTAKNLGDITARLGNVTLVGLAVNQEGRITASTSVRANGSIHLLAKDKGANGTSTRQGVATLGSNSETRIEVEVADKEEALNSLKLNRSRVQLEGGVINIDGRIVAHGGEVKATAGTLTGTAGAGAVSRIVLGENALIDVSGVDATAPMSRHQLELQLFSSQFADTPMLRGGGLFGQTIQVDARNVFRVHDPSDITTGEQQLILDRNFIDFEPALATKTSTIAERYSVGGQVNLSATEVLVAQGSEINVSGGSIHYEQGYVKEIRLLFNGKSTLVSQANRNTPYQAVLDSYSITDKKWGVTRTWNSSNKGSLVQAYTDGGNAGTINISSQYSVLGGTFKANTQVDAQQRSIAPVGGTFKLTPTTSASLPAVRFVEQAALNLPSGFSAVGAFDPVTGTFASGAVLPAELKAETQLATGIIDRGFTHIEVTAGNIAVDAPLRLGHGGKYNTRLDNPLTVVGLPEAWQFTIKDHVTLNGNVAVNRDIVVPGGDVFINVDRFGNIGTSTASVADGVRISTAGTWINDLPGVQGALNAPLTQDAGSIATGAITLGAGSLLDASAGAWLNANGKLTQGKAGNITLGGTQGLGKGGVGGLTADKVQAFGFDKGGALSVFTLLNTQLGGVDPQSASVFWLPESFFGTGGFSKYSVTAYGIGSDVTVVAGTSIKPQMQTWVRNPGSTTLVSGTPMQSVASAVLLPQAQRTPASVALKSSDGALTVAEGASIRLDAPGYSASSGGGISLASKHQLSILGDLAAPAGSISAMIAGSAASLSYDETLSLYIGANASLSAAGHYALGLADKSGKQQARLFNGGSITLGESRTAGGGAEYNRSMTILKEGSVLDVSGASGDVYVNSVNGAGKQTLYGAAGSITIGARNGFVLDGELKGNARGNAAGGRLNLVLESSTTVDTDSGGLHPNKVGILAVTQEKTIRATGLNAGGALSSGDGSAGAPFSDVGGRSLLARGEVSAQQISDGGFDRVGLKVSQTSESDGVISLPSGLNLELPVGLTIDAPSIQVSGSGTAELTASVVSLGSALAGPAPVGGSALLNINADFIDLRNNTVVTGVQNTTLTAKNDIRVGAQPNDSVPGSFKTSGNLTLKARQVYPATGYTPNSYLLEAVGAGKTMEIQSNGQSAPLPLSAAGKLSLKADNIIQGGVLRAPLGEITLSADTVNGKVTFKPGSITSVAATGQLIPYGVTGLGGLNFSRPSTNEFTSTSNNPGGAVSLEKRISATASEIDLQSGATVDISGGGDILTYEFIKGIGGSTDILGQAGVYAILPTAQAEYAPYDPNYNQIADLGDPARNIKPGTNIKFTDLNPGDAVYLSGIPGLAEGTYTLLPGRYALMPGAYMLQTSSSKVLSGQILKQLDGSTLVSGYRTTLGVGKRETAENVTFRITDGKVFRDNAGTKDFKGAAEYRLNSGNALHVRLALENDASRPRIALDAGHLILNTKNTLDLDGTLVAGQAEGGRGALVDIVADNLRVVDQVGASIADTVQLAAGSLNALHAESLLLGGTRAISGDTHTITTTANNVAFGDGAEVRVDELLAVATQTLTAETGSMLATTEKQAAQGVQTLKVSGDGALLGISAANELVLNRTGSTGAQGTLTVQNGALVEASSSLLLDATLNTVLDGEVQVAAQGTATLGATRIQLGNPATVSGMRVSDALIASLGQLSKLTLNSRQNLEIHGASSLGNGALDLVLDTSGLKGVTGAGDTATLLGNKITFRNSSGITSAADVGSGTLEVKASDLVFEGGATGTPPVFGLGGFGTVNLQAQNQVLFNGLGESRINTGALNISSRRISAGNGAVYTLKAAGAALQTSLYTADGLPALAQASGLGGNLRMEAASLDLGGNLELPSGQFAAVASSGDISVSGNLRAASVPVAFDRYTEYTPGGGITLEASAGNVTLTESGVLDVSGGGAQSNADAGQVVLRAAASGKKVTLNGTLHGEAGALGGAGGRFALDSGSLADADFAALNTQLNNGGFDSAREIRVRSGNLTIAGSGANAVKARQVVVTVDGGSLTVSGEIDATAGRNSSIGLYARDSLTLTGSASLKAVSTDAGAEGGQVELATSGVTTSATATGTSVTNTTTGGEMKLHGGSIDVSGGVGGKKGTVRLRAPRMASGLAAAGNADINITNLNIDITAPDGTTTTETIFTTFTGAASVRAEGFRVYSDNSIATADFATTATWYTDARNFMQSVADDNGVGLKRLGKFGDAIFSIVPGVEIRNSGGDVALANDWSLHNWRFDPGNGNGVTAAGNLTSGLNASGKNLLAGVLTLRASGNLNLNNTLSDGFGSAALGFTGTGSTSTPSTTPQGLDAWSYNLAGGADFSSAYLLSTSTATIGTAGDATGGKVVLANNKGIRTGTGDIRLAAGGDLNMGNESSVIYTAGRKAEDLTGFTAPTNALYLTEGGDVSIVVKNNINGKFHSGENQQTVNNWLLRQAAGSTNKKVSWWVRPDLFRQGVATLGGGDVSIAAGGSIRKFSASSATTARYVSDTDFKINGGGNVMVSAAGDIESGIYFAGKGNVRVNAGGEIKAASNTFGAAIALQDGRAVVSAARGVDIEAVFNPTLWVQGRANASNNVSQAGDIAFFLSFTADSAVTVSSLAGKVQVGTSSATAANSIPGELSTNTTLGQYVASATNNLALFVYPASVNAYAYSGDMTVDRMELVPSASGQLRLLAVGDITAKGNIVMSDADLSTIPTPAVIAKKLASGEAVPNITAPETNIASPLRNDHAPTPLHQMDNTPAQIVSQDGSYNTELGSLSLSKALYLKAGRDITLSARQIQHSGIDDISVIDAGRDVVIKDTGLNIAGPGELLVQSGRNVSLGISEGIVSLANTENSGLPDEGASITVVAGLGELGADGRYIRHEGSLAGYIGTYIAPNGAGPATLEADMAALETALAGTLKEKDRNDAAALLQENRDYRQRTARLVTDYMRKVSNNATLSEADAMNSFLAENMDANRQAVFVYRHMSSELLASGKGKRFVDNYSRGENAIAALFPTGNPTRYAGDISLFNSEIRTVRDGSIDLLAPGGLINVGVPTSDSSKKIGIVTELGGAIRAFADKGFQVEQSRVITQFGTGYASDSQAGGSGEYINSDITIWVNNGDIDAGRGSKSAISVPDRVVQTDADGNTTIEVKGSAQGSGIRAQSYDPDGPNKPGEALKPGNAALIAPRGVLNLGEAGVGGGEILIAALDTVGFGGIDAGGGVTGAPAADTGGLSGALAASNVSDASKSVAEEASRQLAQNTTLMPKQDFLPSFISVEVIGLGL